MWDIGLLENYWSSLRLLVQFASGTDEDLHRLVPLMREAPSSKPWVERAHRDLKRVQKGLRTACQDQLRYPKQSRSGDKIRKDISVVYGASEDAAKDFLASWTRFASGRGHVSKWVRGSAQLVLKNIMKPYQKTIKTTEQLFAALGGMPKKASGENAQVSVVKGKLLCTPICVPQSKCFPLKDLMLSF